MFEEHTADQDLTLLRERLAANGYLFLRGVLPAEPLAALHRLFGEAARAAGWTSDIIDDDHPPTAEPALACASPERAYFNVYHQLYRLQQLHQFTTSAVLEAIAASLLEGDVFAHPRLVARIVFPRRPDFVTPPHQDYFQVQGTPNTLTFWIPMHDCPLEYGSLRIAAGSHRDGLLPVRPAPGASGAAVVGAENLNWVSGDFRRGDVLVFTGLTVHSGTPNDASFLRFSLDVRYQRVADPVSRLSLEFSERSDLSWPLVYEGWEDTSRCYYWRDHNLTIDDADDFAVRERDRQAFALAERGDRASISALQRVAAYSTDPQARERAERLLDAMDAAIG